jgi:hypothetical protein
VRAIRLHGRLLLAALAAVAIAAVAIGCGGDDDEDGGETVSAESYVDAVCGSMSEMIAVVQQQQADLAREVQQATPAEGRDLLIAFLDESTAAAESARSGIEDAGVPDVEGGDEVAEALTSAFGELQTTFEDARSETETISTESEAAFDAEADEIGTTVRTAGDQIGESLASVGENEELEAAAEESEACQALAGSS